MPHLSHSRRWLLTLGALLALGSAGSASAYQFAADKFVVSRAGSPLFSDSFDGSTTPPNAPNFVTGTAAVYGLHGTFGTPANGKLIFDSAQASVSSVTPSYVVNRLLLKTDVTDTAPTKGLKPGLAFDALGVFDLTVPANQKEAYLVELGDQQTDVLGKDMIRVGVITDGQGRSRIRFWTQDHTNAPNIAVTEISTAALDTSHQQIQLRLAKSNASSNTVTASYAYVDNGVVGPEVTLSGSAPIFTSRGYTRASLLAYTPVANGNVTGDVKKLSVKADVVVGGGYYGARGNVYLAAITGNGNVFFNNGSGWVLWQSGEFPAYESGITLTNHIITILSDADVSSLAGSNTSIIVGYGQSSADMLNNAAYSVVHTVQ